MVRARVVIAGCGIGGLTAAIALQEQGCVVRLFERSSDFSIVGAGITIGPAATRALAHLGLADALKAASEPPRLGAMIHHKTHALLGTTQDRLDKPDAPEHQYHLLHRADLHALLRAVVLAQDPDAIATDHEFSGFDQDAEGVTVHFSNGQSTRGDLLVGADGLRSRVRERLFGEQDPRFTGQVAYRCLIPFERVKPYIGDYPTAVYLGPKRTLVRYLVRQGSAMNCAAFVRTDQWAEETWSCPATGDELAAHFEGWHPSVLGLFAAAPKDSVFKWALFDRDPLERWSAGRVTLLGDAAHPMLPFLGLGAAMAIEDAVMLARALSQSPDLAGGLSLYEAARRDRTEAVMLASRRQGEFFQSVDIDNFKPSPSTDFENYDAGVIPL